MRVSYKNDKRETVFFNLDTNPSIIKIMKICDSVVDGVINDISGYEPLLEDYFLTISLIHELTDIEIPEGFEDSYNFVENLKLYEIITKKLDSNLISIITDACYEKIEFKKCQFLNKSKSDELFESLTNLVNKLGDSLDGIDFNKTFDDISSLKNRLSEIPEGEIIDKIIKYKNEQGSDKKHTKPTPNK